MRYRQLMAVCFVIGQFYTSCNLVDTTPASARGFHLVHECPQLVRVTLVASARLWRVLEQLTPLAIVRRLPVARAVLSNQFLTGIH